VKTFSIFDFRFLIYKCKKTRRHRGTEKDTEKGRRGDTATRLVSPSPYRLLTKLLRVSVSLWFYLIANQKSKIKNGLVFCLLALSINLWTASLVHAEGSRYYLIEGVYYLMNEGDRDKAEGFFRKAILSSSFDSLSVEGNTHWQAASGTAPALSDAAEAFYFLGKIYYEKAILDTGYSILDTRKGKQESSIQHPASSIENQGFDTLATQPKGSRPDLPLYVIWKNSLPQTSVHRLHRSSIYPYFPSGKRSPAQALQDSLAPQQCQH